jgi:orotidine-5'-phosphate decarboxylase
MHERLASPQKVAPSRPLSRSVEAQERLIVALDFPSAREALALVDRLEGACQWFKVGLELFLAAGGPIVETLHRRGHSVFLDLKLHDIPNTVAAAVHAVGPLGAELLTLHASGGPDMLAAAAEAAVGLTNPPSLLAVTVLTSLDQAQLAATGISAGPASHALRLAQMAWMSGIGGFVCSPEEAANLRTKLPEAILVTPGIRPAGSVSGDQKRIATPSAALAAGADYLVVGRPITQAENPAESAGKILSEMSCWEAADRLRVSSTRFIPAMG